MQIRSIIPYGHQEALVLDIDTVLAQCRRIYNEPYCKYDCLAAYWVQTYYLAEVMLFLPGASEELTQEANTLIYELLGDQMRGKDFTSMCNKFYADGSIKQSLDNAYEYIQPSPVLDNLDMVTEIERAVCEFFSSLVAVSHTFRSTYTFLFLSNFISQFMHGYRFISNIKASTSVYLYNIAEDINYYVMSGAITNISVDKSKATIFNNKVTSFIKDNWMMPVFVVTPAEVTEEKVSIKRSAASALSGFMPEPE